MDKIQDKIISEFEKFSDKWGRFRYFRQLANITQDMAVMQPDGIDDSYLVPLNKRQIWLKARLENERVFFTAYTSSPIYQSLLAIVLKVFSGRRPLEIINCDLYVLREINLYNRLNAEWLGDVLAVLQRIKLLTARLKVYTLT